MFEGIDDRFDREGFGPMRRFGLARWGCALIAAIVLTPLTVTTTTAGGTCLLHAEPFRLQSDVVHWAVKLASGGECIQGLRWSTIMIDRISIVDQPKLGRLLIEGPSFRYLSNPGAHGTDSFKLTITGSSLRVDGTSTIDVDVAVN